MLDKSHALKDQIIAWRRDFHQHPELGFEEIRTSGIVSDELRELGLQVQTGVGKTGVVATLGSGSPVVGIRADMDALPIQEANDVPYASQTPDVMHACGHDSHTAILLAVARMLTQMEDRPAGTIRFLFQPCEETQDEEGKSGGMRMVEEGALDGLDAVIALHVASDEPSGSIILHSGYTMAAVDTFYGRVIGKGGHAAYPHTTIDPIFILAQVINAIHGIRARQLNPINPAVVSIGAVHGGSTTNVIPSAIELMGTIRTYDEKTRQQVWTDLEKAFAVARAFGGDCELRIEKGFPALYNDETIIELMGEVVRDLVGEEVIDGGKPAMGAEDFAFMARKAPGAMFMLGAKYDEVSRPHHNPNFNIDESVLPLGAAILAETAVRLLKQKAE